MFKKHTLNFQGFYTLVIPDYVNGKWLQSVGVEIFQYMNPFLFCASEVEQVDWYGIQM